MISKLKTLIPHEAKLKAKLLLLKNKKTAELGFSIPKKEKKIFIFLAADYGNLGDVAITYAQHKLLAAKYPDHVVMEIPISSTIEGIEFAKRISDKHDVITTVGGGNTGDMYDQIESLRQFVFDSFPENKIISFPQTIDFSETPHGQKMLQKAIKRYSNHKDLTLIAREEVSFATYKKHFPKNNVLLLPDIVMTLDKTSPKYDRKGVLVCLRDDKEKKMTPDQETELLNLLKANYGEVTQGDTHIGGTNMSLRKRVREVHKLWDAFRKSELVVTDRLHGMIFCFITNTPGMVFLNNNHKVLTSYEWIKKAKHIQLVTEPTTEKVAELLETLKNTTVEEKEDLLPHYKDFVTLLTNK